MPHSAHLERVLYECYGQKRKKYFDETRPSADVSNDAHVYLPVFTVDILTNAMSINELRGKPNIFAV